MTYNWSRQPAFTTPQLLLLLLLPPYLQVVHCQRILNIPR
jgi:hypothetical protein